MRCKYSDENERNALTSVQLNKNVRKCWYESRATREPTSLKHLWELEVNAQKRISNIFRSQSLTVLQIQWFFCSFVCIWWGNKLFILIWIQSLCSVCLCSLRGDEMKAPARKTISYMHSNHMYISLLSELISIFRINSTIIQYFIVIARCNLNWTAFSTECCNIKSCDVDKQIIHLRV